MDAGRGGDQRRLQQVVATGIVVAIVIRKIAAGDFNTDSMTHAELTSSRPEFHRDFGDLARREEFVGV